MTITIRTADISSLIKHLLRSWPTSALISLFDVFSFLVVFSRRRTKEDTETNFLWDPESSFTDSVGGYLILWVGIFNNRYCPTSIPIPSCWVKIGIHGVSVNCFLCFSDWFQCTTTHVTHLCNFQVSLCRFMTLWALRPLTFQYWLDTNTLFYFTAVCYVQIWFRVAQPLLDWFWLFFLNRVSRKSPNSVEAQYEIAGVTLLYLRHCL